MKTIRRIRIGAFAAAVGAAIAFGASSVVAAPNPAKSTVCGYFSSATYCAACCRNYGGGYYWDGQTCYCY